MRVALYLRLSDEDRNKLNQEDLSESIKNQEAMLRNYAEENNWIIVGVYQDEDYSGADRDRPNFNKMIKECEKGNIDIVLVKSQARFARDIELIDKYVHNKFYEWNVRFMTYLEKIDNKKKETKKTSQITSMVDEWYIEDTSINIRETLKAKRENGEFTGSFAPYGYKKDTENKNHLVVDYNVSHIVKRIYQEYLDGYSLSKIVNNLNAENILSPLEYKRLNGCKLQIPITQKVENYHTIKQTGYYKIDIIYCNTTKNTLKNMITYLYLSNYSTNLELILNKYNNDKLELYYTTDNEIFEKNFSKNNWIKINIETPLPTNLKCIAIKIKEIQYKQSINIQLEAHLNENKEHKEYYFILKNYLNNKIMNLNFNIKIRKKYKWSIQTIKNILTNEFYIGNLVQFKSTHVSYKNHTIIHNDKTQWIKANNTHEKIIDKHIWEQVQNKLTEKNRSTKNGNIHPLANKIFCMDCQKSFMKCGKSDNDGYSYLCCRDKLEKWKNCNNKKYINEKQIHNFLLKKINQIIVNFFDRTEFNKLENKWEEKNQPEKNPSKEEDFLFNELQKKEKNFIKLYEDYANNLLNDDEFILLKTKYQDDTEKIKARISNIEKEKSIPIQKKDVQKKHPLILKQLDIHFINNFINKIIIGSYNKKENSRKIIIEWNFID